MVITVSIDPRLQNMRPRPVEEIALVRAPVCLAHGRLDTVIPFSSSQELFDAVTSGYT
jgi:predicted esterase